MVTQSMLRAHKGKNPICDGSLEATALIISNTYEFPNELGYSKQDTILSRKTLGRTDWGNQRSTVI